MAARRSTRSESKPRRPRKLGRRETKLAFEALAIEGGLLSPDWLARVAALEAGSQSESDYRVPKGLQLRDEIGRYWRIAQAYWSDFAAGRESATQSEAAQALTERFILGLLRESFGFSSIAATEPLVIAEHSYAIGFTALGGRVPVVIAPAGIGLDTLAPAFGDGGRRRSAFGLAQEYLNAAEGATWGLTTDGLALRILRDNASLTRPAWIEADLERIFKEERYADFAALWLLAHETRFGRADQSSTECALETWREAGREEGTRAREHLRLGVEEALVALGQGFLAHPENSALHAALRDGSLSTAAYFQELLRLVYRLIFLLTVEERGLLHPEGSSAPARRLYAEGYGLRRLRERSIRRSAHDRFSDLWEATKIVFRGLAAGESRLALPALAGIFATTQCPTLDAAKLENRALLLAVFRLSWLRESSGLARVNWRDMGPEELGSVYESLLELVPQVTHGSRLFAFATNETKGNARKTSGSYYTPDSLVQALLDSSLEPVVANTLASSSERPVEALLKLTVVDPACGSGHFLLAAARRLAGHVARFQANGTPSAAEYRHALRQVVGRCLFGVDLNPLAVELCKVSLWMEAVEPGLPLTFLDAHIRHGNALLGTTPDLMTAGVLDAAWEPIEGDDRKVASALRNRNKRSGGGQRALDTLWTQPTESETAVVARAVAELEAAPDTDVEALTRKEERWEDLLDSDAYRHQKLVADTWCAAFAWPKLPGVHQDAAPTNDVWLQIRDRRGHPNALTVKTTQELTQQHGFFHWHLAFPQVFARGRFDVVLGNPPWNEVQFEETSWFESRDPNVASAQNAADRGALISRLQTEDPPLYAEYRAAVREIDAIKHFVTNSGRYPHGSTGKLTTSTLFAALGASLAAPKQGRFGCVVPTGIATDRGASDLFEEFMSSGRLLSLFDFINERLLFPEVRPHQRFCLVTLGPVQAGQEVSSEFAAFLQAVSDLLDRERRYTLTWAELVALSPEAHALPLFQSPRHAGVTRKLVAAMPSLGSPLSGWNPVFQQGTFNVASASEHFRTESDLRALGFSFTGLNAVGSNETVRLVPLYDAKMARQFEWRAASLGFSGHQYRKVSKASTSKDQLRDPMFVPEFAYWVPQQLAEERLGTWKAKWILGFKDVTGITSTRLSAFAFVPRMGIGHVFPLVKLAGHARDHAFIAAWMNSVPVEWVLRQRMHGLHLTKTLLFQVPVPAQPVAAAWCKWAMVVSNSEWFGARVTELAVTSWPLVPLACEMGHGEAPFRYDEERRFMLRAEIDAGMMVLAGLSLAEAEFVFDSLEKLRARDLQDFGKYRTKAIVLSIVGDLEAATLTGQPYATRLDPPPADPRVAHPPDPTRDRTKERAT